MFQAVISVIKWVSLPVLLIASVFSRYAAGYELTVDLAVFLGATILVLRAAWLKEYFWAAGFVSIAVVFIPIFLVTKVFLLMGIACVTTILALWAVFRRDHYRLAEASTETL